jgi:hypothetical protein
VFSAVSGSSLSNSLSAEEKSLPARRRTTSFNVFSIPSSPVLSCAERLNEKTINMKKKTIIRGKQLFLLNLFIMLIYTIK